MEELIKSGFSPMPSAQGGSGTQADLIPDPMGGQPNAGQQVRGVSVGKLDRQRVRLGRGGTAQLYFGLTTRTWSSCS